MIRWWRPAHPRPPPCQPHINVGAPAGYAYSASGAMIVLTEYFQSVGGLTGRPTNRQGMTLFECDAQWFNPYRVDRSVGVERSPRSAIPPHRVVLAISSGLTAACQQRCEPDGNRLGGPVPCHSRPWGWTGGGRGQAMNLRRDAFDATRHGSSCGVAHVAGYPQMSVLPLFDRH
jgi:hypothetical protein